MLIDLKSLWEFWISSEEDLWEYTSFNKLFSNDQSFRSTLTLINPNHVDYSDVKRHRICVLSIAPRIWLLLASLYLLRHFGKHVRLVECVDILAYSTYFLEINVISGTVSNWRQLGFPLTNKLTYFRLLWNSTLKLKSTLDWTLWTSLHIYATTFWLAFILMNIDLLYDQCDENCGTCNF